MPLIFISSYPIDADGMSEMPTFDYVNCVAFYEFSPKPESCTSENQFRLVKFEITLPRWLAKHSDNYASISHISRPNYAADNCISMYQASLK